MVYTFLIGCLLGALFTYLLIMSIPSPNIDWRETILPKLTCAICGKQVAPVEFTMHGGLCEDCFEERHGYSHRTSKLEVIK